MSHKKANRFVAKRLRGQRRRVRRRQRHLKQFKFIADRRTRCMIKTASDAITRLGLLGPMASGHGLLFYRADIFDEVYRAYPGHNGTSFALTMKHIEYIARNGIRAYKTRMT